MVTDLVDRYLRRTLLAIALGGLVLGGLAWLSARPQAANGLWAAVTIPVLAGLLASMVRDILAGRIGVDVIAFISMAAALLLGEYLAGTVVAVMYAGGNLLEDFAVARAEHDLRLSSIAHRVSPTGASGHRSKTYLSTSLPRGTFLWSGPEK